MWLRSPTVVAACLGAVACQPSTKADKGFEPTNHTGEPVPGFRFTQLAMADEGKRAGNASITGHDGRRFAVWEHSEWSQEDGSLDFVTNHTGEPWGSQQPVSLQAMTIQAKPSLLWDDTGLYLGANHCGPDCTSESPSQLHVWVLSENGAVLKEPWILQNPEGTIHGRSVLGMDQTQLVICYSATAPDSEVEALWCDGRVNDAWTPRVRNASGISSDHPSIFVDDGRLIVGHTFHDTDSVRQASLWFEAHDERLVFHPGTHGEDMQIAGSATFLHALWRTGLGNNDWALHHARCPRQADCFDLDAWATTEIAQGSDMEGLSMQVSDDDDLTFVWTDAGVALPNVHVAWTCDGRFTQQLLSEAASTNQGQPSLYVEDDQVAVVYVKKPDLESSPPPPTGDAFFVATGPRTCEASP